MCCVRHEKFTVLIRNQHHSYKKIPSDPADTTGPHRTRRMENSSNDTTDCFKSTFSNNLLDINKPPRSVTSALSSNSSIDGFDTEGSSSRHAVGVRSPVGTARGGRPIKEFEEQLSSLKKENFDLKLRIYFLEEKMGGKFTFDKDNIIKKYVELQVESENLKKEVQEKHELLCQAVRAMEIEDEEHKKHMANKEQELSMCQQELEDVRMQLQLHLEKENNAALHLLASQLDSIKIHNESLRRELKLKDEAINELHEDVKSANEKILDLNTQLVHFEGLHVEVEQLKRKNSQLKMDLERAQKMSERSKAIRDARIGELEEEVAARRAHVQRLQQELDTAGGELRRNQNIAVASNSDPVREVRTTHPHDCLVSVQGAAAPRRAEEEDASHVQVAAQLDHDAAVCAMDHGESPTNVTDGTNNSDFESIKTKYSTMKQKFLKLKTEQIKACQIIKSMIESRDKANDEIHQLREKVAGLERELESVVTKPTAEGNMSKRKNASTVVAPKTEKPETAVDYVPEDTEYKILIAELDSQIKILMTTSERKDQQLAELRERYEDMLQALEVKERRVVDLELELLSSNRDVDVSVSEKSDTTKRHSSFYRHEIEEKDKEIERLSVELRKCTSYLQEIVNKELWEKNKEIEKLHTKQANSPEVQKLKKDLVSKDTQLKLLKEKISELGLDVDVVEECKQHVDCKEVVNKLKDDLEKSEKLRLDANEVCSLLNSRLEELAVFLDSLLKQKTVLGYLGIHKEQKLREIVSTSLDLSKTFSSFIYNPDQSVAQLANITTLLNGSSFQELKLDASQVDESTINYSLNPADATLTYHSRLSKPKTDDSVIAALREQIVNLKSELQLRDNELNKFNTRLSETDQEPSTFNFSKLFVSPSKSTTTTLKPDYQSESESWSEPDRTVSKARMGLNNETVKNVNYLSESTEDEESMDKLSSVKNKHLLQEEVKCKTQQLKQLEEKLQNTELIHNSLMENKKLQISSLENQLKESEQSRADAEARIGALNNEIQQLSEAKLALEHSFAKKDKETQNIINQLQVEKDDALKQLTKLHCDAEVATERILALESQIDQLQKDKLELDQKIRNEYEVNFLEQLRQIEVEAEKDFLRRLKEVENDANEMLNRMKEEYANNYVKKSDVEDKLKEVDARVSEIDDLKAIVNSYEATIEGHRIRERELLELREKFDSLDGEKKAVEAELERYKVRVCEFKEQVDGIRSEFESINQSLQQQVYQLQTQKNKLQVKVSELENANAELKNKLVRLEVHNQNANVSMPNMTCRNINLPAYTRKYSEEESLSTPVGQKVDIERAEANSSPDLGIDSDHGRFSSLETNPIRPLQPTIQLTESMSNLLDGGDRVAETIGDCSPKRCCQKAMEVVQENSELKRKILRMRRSLEEMASQLNMANQRKKQVEKTICKQIHKTSQVLKKAKANLDSGSESDMLNKM